MQNLLNLLNFTHGFYNIDRKNPVRYLVILYKMEVKQMKDFILRNDTKLLFRNDPTADLIKLTAGKKYYLFMVVAL